MPTYEKQLQITGEKYIEEEQKHRQILQTKKDFPLPFFLIYTPAINILLLLTQATTSKYRYHLQNGIGISIIFLISITIEVFTHYYTAFMIAFLIIPIAYGIGYKNRIAYKIPIFWHIGKLFFWKNISEIKEKNENKPESKVTQMKNVTPEQTKKSET